MCIRAIRAIRALSRLGIALALVLTAPVVPAAADTLEKSLAIARRVAKKYRNALRELAK